MNVLSLFNGMNTGRVALENVGIKVDNYYSSEIKPAAIELTDYHYPDTIQLGDITNWKSWKIDFSSIDLILSGSPCKDLSLAGKRAGLKGANSSLFYVFIDILNYIKELNPEVKFLQENVASAPSKDVYLMSKALGVKPQKLNSNLVTAQNRNRYYWSNIRTKEVGLFKELTTAFPIPKDRKIKFRDIITDSKDKIEELKNSGFSLIFQDQQKYFIKTNTKKGKQEIKEGEVIDLSYPTSLNRRARITANNKAPCLLEGNCNLYTLQNNNFRLLNKIELCRLQGFPDNYCDILSRNKAVSLLGDGWTLPIIEHFFKYLKDEE